MAVRLWWGTSVHSATFVYSSSRFSRVNHYDHNTHKEPVLWQLSNLFRHVFFFSNFWTVLQTKSCEHRRRALGISKSSKIKTPTLYHQCPLLTWVQTETNSSLNSTLPALDPTFYVQVHKVWQNLLDPEDQSPTLLKETLTVNALCARVYIHIQQLSSFRAPTLRFIDLTVATCHIQYTFLSLAIIFFTRNRTKHENTRSPVGMIWKWPPKALTVRTFLNWQHTTRHYLSWDCQTVTGKSGLSRWWFQLFCVL